MNSTDILHLIELIGETSKTTSKIELLKEFLEDETFLKIVQYAYDPLINFGVLSVGPVANFGDGHFTGETFELLEKLSRRELTGFAAHSAIHKELCKLTPGSEDLFLRILNKDLRAGIGDKSINAARSGTIHVMPYMRCALLKEVKPETFPWATGVFVQLKADGMFTNVTYHDSENIIFQTRKGIAFIGKLLGSIFKEIKEFLKPGYQYHGELLVYYNGKLLKRKEGNGVLNRVIKSGIAPDPGYTFEYVVWDAVKINVILGDKGPQDPYKLRLLFLDQWTQNASQVKTIEYTIAYSLDEAKKFAKAQQKKGLEGAVFKHPEMPWMNGDSKLQVKLKAEFCTELRAIAMNPGTGKNEKYFGSLLCVSECCDLVVNVSGFTDAERKDIFNNWDSTYKNSILSVTFNELITSEKKEEYSLFLPEASEWRFDKDTADTLDKIKLIVTS